MSEKEKSILETVGKDINLLDDDLVGLAAAELRGFVAGVKAERTRKKVRRKNKGGAKNKE